MRHKRTFVSLFIALAAIGVLGAGTFATFSAETRNPSNLFANGTLVLSNKVNTNTACLSTGAGTSVDAANTNSNCDAIFNMPLQKPGDSASSNLTIKNVGSLAGVLSVYSTACVDSVRAGETYSGSANACDKVLIQVQEFSAATRLPSERTDCLYGGETVANQCDFSDATKNLSDFAGYSSAPLDLGSLAAGADRFYKVAILEPSTVDNSAQGKKANMNIVWHLEQA